MPRFPVAAIGTSSIANPTPSSPLKGSKRRSAYVRPRSIGCGDRFHLVLPDAAYALEGLSLRLVEAGSWSEQFEYASDMVGQIGSSWPRGRIGEFLRADGRIDALLEEAPDFSRILETFIANSESLYIAASTSLL
jgi:hypothetical protein